MNPETKKNFNVIVGGVLSVLGFICFGVAAYAATVPAPSKPAPVSPQPIVNTSSCQQVLNQMGYVATLTSTGVLARDESLEDPQAALTKATAAIGLCRLQLQEFCMGSECATPGLTFSLQADPRAEATRKTATEVKTKKAA